MHLLAGIHGLLAGLKNYNLLMVIDWVFGVLDIHLEEIDKHLLRAIESWIIIRAKNSLVLEK